MWFNFFLFFIFIFILFCCFHENCIFIHFEQISQNVSTSNVMLHKKRIKIEQIHPEERKKLILWKLSTDWVKHLNNESKTHAFFKFHFEDFANCISSTGICRNFMNKCFHFIRLNVFFYFLHICKYISVCKRLIIWVALAGTQRLGRYGVLESTHFRLVYYNNFIWNICV